MDNSASTYNICMSYLLYIRHPDHPSISYRHIILPLSNLWQSYLYIIYIFSSGMSKVGKLTYGFNSTQRYDK